MSCLNCEGLLPLSNIFETVCQIENEDTIEAETREDSLGKYDSICSFSSSNKIAFGKGNILTILDSSSDSVPIDLEFDFQLSSLTWDKHGFCVVIGDVNGSLHFVSCEGILIIENHRLLQS